MTESAYEQKINPITAQMERSSPKSASACSMDRCKGRKAGDATRHPKAADN